MYALLYFLFLTLCIYIYIQIYAVSKRETFGLSQEQVIALGLVIAPYPSPVGLKVWSPDWQHQSPGKLVRKADLQACS